MYRYIYVILLPYTRIVLPYMLPHVVRNHFVDRNISMFVIIIIRRIVVLRTLFIVFHGMIQQV
jgi:hypothetical protein